jgi:threonine dehydrogenase-like Zn-dependent dehydrogenase
MHGVIVQLEKGDILGHEFCGKVESLGPGVKGPQKGDRVVASFQIACGEVRNSFGNLEPHINYHSAITARRSYPLSAKRRTQIPWQMEW